MKAKKKKSIEFMQQPEDLKELNLNEIKGGRSVDGYVGCGEHHSGMEKTSRILKLI